MSKWEKLLMRIKSLDKNMRFDELKKVLEAYGYEMSMPKSGSSHVTFRKKGELIVTIPKHGKIKPYYVGIVKMIIEKEENENEKC